MMNFSYPLGVCMCVISSVLTFKPNLGGDSSHLCVNNTGCASYEGLFYETGMNSTKLVIEDMRRCLWWSSIGTAAHCMISLS